ncbi:hypothetical protein [Micromonospora sp. NPDC005237]
MCLLDFIAMSVAPDRRPPEADWQFRFYGVEDVVARVTVSGDGHRLIAEP